MMKSYTEKNYGADADGNRGVSVTFYELDDSAEEREEITLALYDDFCAGDARGVKTVYLSCDGEKIEEIVSIEDYLDELIAMAKDDESFAGNAEFQKWLTITAIEYHTKVIERLLGRNGKLEKELNGCKNIKAGKNG